MKKIEYINKINTFFRDARNHGNSGSWWYPKQNRIAYNVKMRSFCDTDTLRKSMTARQNEFYSDNELYDRAWYGMIEDEATMLMDEIKDTYSLVKDCGMAGRSGGWLEVDYQNDLIEVDETTDKNDIAYYYKLAKELEKQEGEVRELIEQRHKALNAYIDTPEYYKDIAENVLYDDEVIGEFYKDKIKTLTDKLN